jgi:hypothetical protein
VPFLGRFSHTTNARPAATRIKPQRKMNATGAPVFARVPVDATGFVPVGGSDGVPVPALSPELGDGVVLMLSGVVVGDGDSNGDGLEDGDGLGDGLGDGGEVGDGDGLGVAPVL